MVGPGPACTGRPPRPRRSGQVLGSAAVLALTNAVQAYAWGAVDGLARLVGTPATGGAEAELWVGAHPSAPSRTSAGRPLDQVIAEDPEGVLGREVTDRFGGRLPFLLKVLAIGAPLSIQLHPSPEQARDGYAREEAAGVARDDPRRSYRDPHAKPEVLVALEPTWVLAGFRTGAAAADALEVVAGGAPAVADLQARVADAPDARAGLIHLLSAPDAERSALAAAATGADPADGPAAGWTAALAEAHPGDPSALSPLLLELRRLEPGQGIFLPAGVPHLYLHGAGVELMGASDNVVRGGLTAKHVDRDELVRLLAPPGVGPDLLPGVTTGDGATAYITGTPEIALHRMDLRPDGVAIAPEPAGPALVLAVHGTARLAADGAREDLGHGRAVLVPAGERADVRAEGSGTAWWATVGPSTGR